ncbi:ejaculatory bulb-specific protein 3-like [Danaus plexippus]|uniref:ejaculatory bulb-specific protein 3-like n=1 Tax=Danaus plexippus TaxID=13037 RepID=UPI002AAF9FF8|nr:ejaculatory bulb-specific protein 3-like [Danaus plexippus]
MKTLTAFSLFFMAKLCLGDNSYTTKYDGINLDEILASHRLLTGYINCLLDKGPCSPDGKELKNNLPEAIDNDCHKCTQRQKEGADKVMHFIIDNRPEDWDKLEEKYNSDGSYKLKYLTTKLSENSEDVSKNYDEDDEEVNGSRDHTSDNDHDTEMENH